MELVFYDRTGRAVAYSSDGKHIFTFDGSPVAYLDRGSVYSYSGSHMGWFVDGWVRDDSGHCVFFTQTARGGPVKPVKAVKPVKGVKSVKPVKGVKQVRPVKPVNSLSWSDQSGPQFFGR
jgi:hypothetical protein